MQLLEQAISVLVMSPCTGCLPFCCHMWHPSAAAYLCKPILCRQQCCVWGSLPLAAAGRHLIVDGASLAALDIFKEEAHPSAMGIGSSKEGVSVYGLLQRCVTGMVRPAKSCYIAALLPFPKPTLFLLCAE